MKGTTRKIILKLTFVLLLSFLSFILLNHSSASAHPNAIDWSPCNGQYPPNGTGKQTAWSLVDNTYSQYSGYIGDTVTATLKLEARGCHNQFAFNSRYIISGQNLNNIWLPFQYDIGTVGLFGWTPNVHYQTVQFTIQPSDYGDTGHCVSWNAGGYYNAFNNAAGPFQFDGTGTDTWCFTVYNQGYPPPPPQPKGNIVVTKYGSWEWNTVCIRQEGVAAAKACNWYNQVMAIGLDASVKYNVQSDPTTSATVLAGYRLNYYDTNGLHSCHAGEFPGAVDSGLNGLYGLLCFGANIPGRTFSNLSVSDGNTTYLDLYYKDVPPVGNFENLTCDTTNERLTASGWAMDLSKSSQAIDVALYYAGDANSPGTQYITTTANGLGRAGENWAGVSLNGHLFSAQLPANLYDGTQHYIYAYALGIDKNGNKNNDNTFIGKRAITCTPQPKYYPWLQTQKGDVISLKNIIGQEIGTLPNLLTDHPGARHGNSGNKNTPFSGSPAADQQNPESYFVIAEGQADTVTNHFCSGNLYTLGSPQNDNQEGCGLRYNYSMAGIDIAKIKQDLQTTWDQNGAGSGTTCSPYRTRLLGGGLAYLINGDLTLGCPNGGIQRYDGNYSLSGFFGTPNPTITGRGTLWVKGNLTIGKNITYGGVGTFTDPKKLPNFAIFVDGDVTIDQSVTQIDAMIIATGRIYTCTQSTVSSAACSNPLRINGLLASEGKIDFGRRWFVKENPNVNPAENIVLTGQSIILPPPGLDKRDSSIDSSLQINSGELPPRLN